MTTIFLALLPSQYLVHLVDVICELLVLVLLRGLPAVLHLQPQTGRQPSAWLLSDRCTWPTPLQSQTPSCEALRLLKNRISERMHYRDDPKAPMINFLYHSTTEVTMDFSKPF